MRCRRSCARRLSVTSSAITATSSRPSVLERVDVDQPAALAAGLDGGLEAQQRLAGGGDDAQRRLGDLADLARQHVGQPAADLLAGLGARQLGERGGDDEHAQVLVVDRDADPGARAEGVDQRGGDVARRPAHSTDQPTRPSAAASSWAAIVFGGVSLPSSATAPASAAWVLRTGSGVPGDQHDAHVRRRAVLPAAGGRPRSRSCRACARPAARRRAGTRGSRRAPDSPSEAWPTTSSAGCSATSRATPER